MTPTPDTTRPFPFRFVTALAAALAAVLVVLGAPAAGAAAARLTGGPLYGGMVMTDSSGFRCISGFNAYSGSTYYVITSGSCTSSGSSWYIGGDYLGPSAGSTWPGGAYGLIQVADPTHWQPQGAIRVGAATVDITGTRYPTIGSQVCTGNETSSGVHCGTVEALNVSVNFGDGVVNGLAQTNLCNEPGSTGSPIFSGSSAMGIMIGGSGNCSSGGTSYFQPLPDVLSAYGLALV